MKSSGDVYSDRVELSEEEIQDMHLKILHAMCPSKDLPLKEQLGYYNYYCQYYHTEEEEHKIETWKSTIETVYWNMTKRMIIRQEDLLKIIVINQKNLKSTKKMLEILEARKVLVRVNKVFNNQFYQKEEKKGGFWGASIFKKAKEMFTGGEEQDDELVQETKTHLLCISALEYVTKEIMNHVAVEEIVPIITHQKFHTLCVEKFGLNQLEKKLLEKHLVKTSKIKHSKATISFNKGRYHKEYNIIRFINLHLLRVNSTSKPAKEDSNKITELQLMLFELEINHNELKSGVIQVEGRKEFIENNIKGTYQSFGGGAEQPPVDDEVKDKIKLEIKKLRLFDHIWMKLSQCIALIDEEIPRIKTYKEHIPKDTVKMFVIESRKDLKNLEESMQYVETVDLYDVPDERIPKFFEDIEEITEEDLEREFYSELNILTAESEGLEDYDSILDKLRKNIRSHTQSFYQESKGLDDSFIHSYNANGRDYVQTLKMKNYGNEAKFYRGSMVIHNGDEEEDEDEEDGNLNLSQILRDSL